MLLNLEGFTIDRTEMVDEEMCIYVTTNFTPNGCLKCRNLLARFYGHGSRQEVFHDLLFLLSR